jgi:hypothetical protein
MPSSRKSSQSVAYHQMCHSPGQYPVKEKKSRTEVPLNLFRVMGTYSQGLSTILYRSALYLMLDGFDDRLVVRTAIQYRN